MGNNRKVKDFIDAMISGEPQRREVKEELQEETIERLKITPELTEALNRERTKDTGRPRKNRPTQETGTKKGETRATFIVNKLLVRKVKYISVIETKLVKDIIDEALSQYITRWEEENGEIKLISKEEK